MKFRIISTTIVLFIALSISAQNADLSLILNKTWNDESSLTGSSWVFVKTNDEKLKAIYQMHGSGIPVLYSIIFDADFKNDTIILRCITLEQDSTTTFTFAGNTLIQNEKILQSSYLNKPIIHVSTFNRKFIDKRIDLSNYNSIVISGEEIILNDTTYYLNPIKH